MKTKTKTKTVVAPTNNPHLGVVRKDGSIIVNERCSCGALRTEHGDRFAAGHGSSAATDCPQFTWASFVTVAGK